MFVAAFFQSFVFPALGYFLSKLQFIYYGAENDQDGAWIEERN